MLQGGVGVAQKICSITKVGGCLKVGWLEHDFHGWTCDSWENLSVGSVLNELSLCRNSYFYVCTHE